MVLSDLHKDSAIDGSMDADTALQAMNQKLKDTERGIEDHVNNIKNYFSYEEMKDRFLQSIMNNPKGIINTLLILREIIVSRRKKKWSDSFNTISDF